MSQDNLVDNKRIAKNTLFLSFRMFFIMLVSLYTSRIVLRALGVVDYGIYNVVGGIVVMFSILNSSMSSATQRFLTFEIGRENLANLKKVFAAAYTIHLIIAIAILFLTEIVGVWFLKYKLVIPVERLNAANWVLQFSVLTFCTSVIQVPFNAVLIAHERMNIFAYISIAEAGLKLLSAFLITIVPCDKLIIYACLVFAAQCIIRFVYQFYCIRNFVECSFTFFWDKTLYKNISSFAGWNIFGSIAWLLKDQGLNFLLNIFFGPAINAARGLSYQVSGALSGFVSNFTLALNPQITKNYAQGKLIEMEVLSYRGLKFSYMLLFLIIFPILINVDFILTLWLGNVPHYTSIFLKLILIDSIICSLFGSPLITSLMATGDIKKYQIVVSSCIVILFPLSYIALTLKCNPESVFYLMIFVSLLSGIVRLYFCVNTIGYSWTRYLEMTIIPVLKVTFLSIPLSLVLKYYIFNQNNIADHLYIAISSILVISMGIFSMGLTKTEKDVVINKMTKMLKNEKV